MTLLHCARSKGRTALAPRLVKPTVNSDQMDIRNLTSAGRRAAACAGLSRLGSVLEL